MPFGIFDKNHSSPVLWDCVDHAGLPPTMRFDLCYADFYIIDRQNNGRFARLWFRPVWVMDEGEHGLRARDAEDRFMQFVLPFSSVDAHGDAETQRLGIKFLRYCQIADVDLR